MYFQGSGPSPSSGQGEKPALSSSTVTKAADRTTKRHKQRAVSFCFIWGLPEDLTLGDGLSEIAEGLL